ncbi:MAG TPA: hypothetical protein VF307_03165 [Candidatus Nanopelagicaceae bacterium]
MNNLARLGQSMVVSHSHEEVWNLAPGLSPEFTYLAQDLLPAMKQYKRLIIRIGAASLGSSSSPAIETLGQELSSVCNNSVMLMTDRYASALDEGLVGQIIRETTSLGNQAMLISSFGMDGESARSLRLAYRALRSSCALLWLYEFAPEGRPQFVGGQS